MMYFTNENIYTEVDKSIISQKDLETVINDLTQLQAKVKELSDKVSSQELDIDTVNADNIISESGSFRDLNSDSINAEKFNFIIDEEEKHTAIKIKDGTIAYLKRVDGKTATIIWGTDESFEVISNELMEFCGEKIIHFVDNAEFYVAYVGNGFTDKEFLDEAVGGTTKGIFVYGPVNEGWENATKIFSSVQIDNGLFATNAVFEEAKVKNIQSKELSSEDIEAEALSAVVATVDNAKVDILLADKEIVKELKADDLDVVKGQFAAINSKDAKVELLDADGVETDKLATNFVVGLEKNEIELVANPANEAEWIEVHPFTGDLHMELIKDDNVVLSLSINETASKDYDPSIIVNYTSDDRDYLKKICVADNGNLYFKTWNGGGKLRWTYHCAKDTLAPETYRELVIQGTLTFSKDILDTAGIISNKTIGDKIQYTTEGTEVKEDIDLLNSIDLTSWFDGEYDSAITQWNNYAITTKIQTPLSFTFIPTTGYDSKKKMLGDSVLVDSWVNNTFRARPVGQSYTAAQELRLSNLYLKIADSEVTNAKIKWSNINSKKDYVVINLANNSTSVVDNDIEYEPKLFIANKKTYIKLSTNPATSHIIFSGQRTDSNPKVYYPNTQSSLNENLDLGYFQYEVSYVSAPKTDLEVENLTVTGTLHYDSISIPSDINVQNISATNLTLGGKRLDGVHTTVGEFNENLIYPVTQYTYDMSEIAFDGVFYEKANFMDIDVPAGTRLFYVVGDEVKYCGSFPPYSGLRYGSIESVNANKTWFENLTWLGETTLDNISYSTPTIDVKDRSVATQKVQAFVDYRQNAINDLLDLRSAEALYKNKEAIELAKAEAKADNEVLKTELESKIDEIKGASKTIYETIWDSKTTLDNYFNPILNSKYYEIAPVNEEKLKFTTLEVGDVLDPINGVIFNGTDSDTATLGVRTYTVRVQDKFTHEMKSVTNYKGYIFNGTPIEYTGKPSYIKLLIKVGRYFDDENKVRLKVYDTDTYIWYDKVININGDAYVEVTIESEDDEYITIVNDTYPHIEVIKYIESLGTRSETIPLTDYLDRVNGTLGENGTEIVLIDNDTYRMKIKGKGQGSGSYISLTDVDPYSELLAFFERFGEGNVEHIRNYGVAQTILGVSGEFINAPSVIDDNKTGFNYFGSTTITGTDISIIGEIIFRITE